MSLIEAIIQANWHQIDDLKTKKDLVFVLMRAQKAVLLEVGILGRLNYPLFVSVNITFNIKL